MKKNLKRILSCTLGACLLLSACGTKPPAETAAKTEASAKSQEMGDGAATGAAAGAASGETGAAETKTPETTAAANKNPDIVKVATTPHIASTAIWAADRLGYFEEENIKIETTSFVAMAPAIAALASGDIDVSYMGVGVHSLAAKGQVKIFAVNNISYGDYFIGNKSLGADSLENLGDKTIAVPKGSTGDMLVNMVLKKNGLNPEDYNIVNMDAAGVVAAMTAGKIAACGIWEPFVSEITSKLGSDEMVYLGQGKDYADDVAFIGSYGASDKMFNEKRDVLVRFTRAYAKATDYLAEHPEELLTITVEETQATKEAISSQIDSIKLFTGDEFKTAFTDGTAMAWYDSLINAMVDVGVVEEAVPASEFVDATIVQDALK